MVTTEDEPNESHQEDKNIQKRSGDEMRWSQHFRVVDRVLTQRFHQLGHLIGNYPGYFILVPLFLTALAATGFQQIHYEDDPAYLFSPVTGRSKEEKRIVSRLFPDNFSAFNSARMTDLGKFARLLITARDGGTLLRPQVFADIVRLNELVRAVEISNGEQSYRFDDLCAKWDGKCIDNAIVRLEPFVADVQAGKINLTYPVWFSENYDAFIFPAFLGSPEVSDDGYLRHVPALQLIYWAANHTDFDVNLSLLWESGVLEMLDEKESSLKQIQVSRFMSQTLKVELEQNTVTVIPYMSLTVILMVSFCVITSMMSDCVRTKPFMGLMGVASASMATITAFGLLMYCRLDFIGINLAAPFLMLGIGIDDTFVMLAAWRRTRLQDPVPRRLAMAYEEAAVSITITSLTDMFSFWVGAITPFPSVQIFCVYTGLSVVMTYIWHVTLFGAVLAISGYLEQANRHGITCRPVLAVSEAESEQKSCCYRGFCSGGISSADPWNPVDNRDHIVMKFFKNGVGKALNIPAVKALVLMVFLVYLGVAIWGCTMVREGLERRRLSKDNSYSVSYYDQEDKYFREHPYRVQVIVEGNIDYFEPQIQTDLENLLQTFENSTYVDTSFYTEAWLREWISFVKNNQEILELNVSTRDLWMSELKKIYLSGSNSVYSRDVVFDASGKNIVASRFIIQTKHVNNTVEDKDMMEELRNICDESKFKCSIYHPLFVFFDQFVLVRTISIQSICIAAAIMCIVSLIFIPNPVCSVWVAFSIVSIEIGVIGYMTLWDVNLDSISMINLIMCIGFSVDFSAHISYAYMSAAGKTSEQRIQISLHALGLPILQGGFSTILGVSTLYFAPSYIFVTFFKTNFLVIFFGMVHGIFLLPVLLSLFGPGSRCGGGGDDDSIDHGNAEKGEIKATSTPDLVGAPEGVRSDGFYYLTAGHVMPLRGAKLSQVPLRIPRPQARPASSVLPCNGVSDAQVRLETGAFTVATGEQRSLEKDLGLGTSGEDSSESSLSKAAGSNSSRARTQRSVAPVDLADDARALPLQQVYNNAGYQSDEEDAEAASTRRPRRGRSASVGGDGVSPLKRAYSIERRQ